MLPDRVSNPGPLTYESGVAFEKNCYGHVWVCIQLYGYTLHTVKGSNFVIFILATLFNMAPITTAADDSLEYFFHCFSDKIMLEISCESSAWQRIHMKHQSLFSIWVDS